MEETVFSRIIRGDLPADKVFENDKIIAIKDLHPIAPVHLLIISKKVIPNLSSVTGEDAALISEMVMTAKKLAAEFGISEGYRLLTNNGISAGQTIFHLHMHLIGGRPLGAMG